jgi:hypothetical protein
VLLTRFNPAATTADSETILGGLLHCGYFHRKNGTLHTD